MVDAGNPHFPRIIGVVSYIGSGWFLREKREYFN